MQRRHFEFIASVIARLPAPCREEAATAFAQSLRRTHYSFNADRFLKACGLEENE